MALKAVVDSLDSIDASLHDLYAEKDGKFILQIEGIRDHPEALSLRNALDRVRREKAEAAERLTTAEARLDGLPDDFDAAAYEALREKAEAIEDGGGTPDEQVTRLKEQHDRKIASIEQKHQREVTKLQGEITKRDGEVQTKDAQLQRSVIETRLSAAMDEANIDPKHRKKLVPYLKTLGKFKVADDEGELSAIVETDMGEMPVLKFVTDWAGSDDGKEYVTKATGLDSKGSDGRRMEGNPFAKQSWNKTQQGVMIRDDRAKAERMAKAAGFASVEAASRAREAMAA